MNRKIFPVIFLSIASGSALLWAAADWQKTNPSQWNSEDVYQILNSSPWSKSVKTTFTNPKDPADQLGNQSSGGSAPPNVNQTPGYGGMGRRGYGGAYGGSGRTYSSSGSSGNSKSSGSSGQGPTIVTIQWQSALPVQIAAAKKVAGDAPADLSQIKPADNYIVAVIGLPIRAIGGRAASVDSDQTTDEDETNNLENRLLGETELLRDSREPLHPVKVALNQGADGRILFYFPKNDPITTREKMVEFRLTAGHTEIKKKFDLKDMQYHGKLEL